MNTTEQELENVLRSAPRPAPPAGLKERLIAEVQLPMTPRLRTCASAWLRRWWPVLAPAAASAACAVGLAVQQAEIRELQHSIRGLSHPAARPTAVLPPTVQTNAAADQAQHEIARLRELADRLTAEIRQLEQLGVENARLRTELSRPAASFLTPQENEDLAQAQERAESINCMNNMKQLGLAARVWAVDNEDPVTRIGLTPPTILDMSNEVSVPKILVCPSDRGREPARDWKSFTTANCSYEYLAPSAPDTEPDRVMFRCPIHGHIGLCDGSVQGYVAKKHPERLVRRDGKLYLPEPPPPTPAPAPQPATAPPAAPNQ